MRNTTDSSLAALLTLLFFPAQRWLHLPVWTLLIPVGMLVLDLLGFCLALYQRRRELRRGELEQAKHLDRTSPASEERAKRIPWGKLWLTAALLLALSPILLTTHWFFFAMILLFGPPILVLMIFVIGLDIAADERREELKKGELKDAEKF